MAPGKNRPRRLAPDSIQAPLQIALLGTPRVEWQGQPLSIPRRSARALLYFLAYQRRPVARSQICSLFWPEVGEATARRNLSHLLTHLRRALPSACLLRVEDDTCALDPERYECDATEFGRSPQSKVLSTEELGRLVVRYHGPFLTGFALPESPGFESWVIQQRGILERGYVETLRILVDQAESQGDVPAAVSYARSALAVDDLDEVMHRRLIKLLGRSGDRAGVQRQFDACTAALERELGVSPLPETRAAYHQTLEGGTIRAARDRSRPKWATLPSLDAPLVGRREALRRLTEVYEIARSGRGQAVLIEGEAGIGKSRVMQEFCTRLWAPALVLVGAGVEGQENLPYHPIVDPLRAKMAEEGFSSISEPARVAEAVRLLPEVRQILPDLVSPVPADPGEARVRLMDAVTYLMLASTDHKRPTILCIDDLHWADSETIDWLGYLSKRLGDHPLLFIGSSRTEPSPPVQELVSRLGRSGALTRVRLDGLGIESVSELLAHFDPELAGNRNLARGLQAATGGNPFFILETIRALFETGQLKRVGDGNDALPLPETVRAAVEARLNRMSDATRQVLDAAAILGPRFSFDSVRRTAGRGEEETTAGLDEAIARQVLAADGAYYRFTHELTRRAVAAQISPIRWQILHRRAGEAMEEHDPEGWAALAYHFEEGALLERALYYHRRAAASAGAVFAWQEVEAHQSHMLAILDQQDPECRRLECLAERCRLLTARAHLRFLGGRLEERDIDILRMVELGLHSGDVHTQLRGLVVQARYLNLDGRYAEALEVAGRGLSVAGDLGDHSTRSSLLAEVGFAHYFRGEYSQALNPLKEALGLHPEDPSVRSGVLSVLSYIYYLLAEYERSLDYRKQALALRTDAGEVSRGAWDLTDMGVLYTCLHRLDRAEQYLRESLELAVRIGSQPAEAYARNNLGNLHSLRGEYGAALECYGRALELQRATGSRRGEASALSNTGMVLTAIGAFESAIAPLRQALAIQEEIGYTSGLSEGLAHLSRALAGLGRLDEAIQAADRALMTAEKAGDRASRILALVSRGWLSLRRNDPKAAMAWAEEGIEIGRQTGLVHGEALGWASMAMAHLALGELEDALEASTKAARLTLERGPIDGPEEAVYLIHARTLAALGRAEDARAAQELALTEIARKAALIPDPVLRGIYSSSWNISDFPRL